MVNWFVAGSVCVGEIPGAGGGCVDGCWCRRRRPKVLRVAWGRAGLSCWMRCSVLWSWSSVRMGSEYLILSVDDVLFKLVIRAGAVGWQLEVALLVDVMLFRMALVVIDTF